MKKQNLLSIALFFISTMTFSQNLSFGVRGGLNVANLSSIDLSSSMWLPSREKKPRINFNAGIYGQYSLNEKMALQAELFYSGEGVKFKHGGNEAPEQIKLNYLSLPVLFKYNIVKNFYAMAGPQFSYLLAAHSIYENGSVNVLSEHNKIAIGFVPVIGYDWKNISFNLRYQIGLSKLPKSQYGGNLPYSDDKVKSNVFSVVVSYRIFNVKE